jgi:hypothetical protein
MLIAEENLEIEHILSHALETEMSRFDYACVNGSDRNLMSGGALERRNLVGINVSAKRIKHCADPVCNTIAIYLSFSHTDGESYKKTYPKSSAFDSVRDGILQTAVLTIWLFWVLVAEH